MKVIRDEKFVTFCEMLGGNMRYCRLKNGMPQKSLAYHLGVSHQNVQKYEAGDIIPSAYRLKQIADFYKVKTDDLSGLKEDFERRLSEIETNEDRLAQDNTADRNKALKSCLQKLSESQRKLVEERYKPGASVQKIAADQGRTVGAISQTLYRIRPVSYTHLRAHET